MIRLRRTLVRGRRHPLLGPLLLIVLVLLLTLTFMHEAQESVDFTVVIEVALCVAVVTALAPLLLDRLRRVFAITALTTRLERGPPTWVGCPRWRTTPLGLSATLVTPLRR